MKNLLKRLSSLNGVGLSVLLHGGLAAVACISLTQVRPGGSSGQNGNGEGLAASPGFSAAFHQDEEKLDGTPAPDVRDAGPVVDDDTPIELDPQRPSIPFDAFAVEFRNNAEDRPSTDPADIADPSAARFAASVRGSRLPSASPPAAESGSGTGQAGPIGTGKGEGTGTGEGSGDGSGDGQGAVQVYSPRPSYPREARRQSIEGTVVVELAVHVDGTATVNRIIQSSGSQVLDDAVVATVATWKYKPASEGGRPVTTIEKIRFVFQLSK